jgi:site-specific DNA recombinase
VIVDSIDRLSRMTADGTRIERELEDRDVALFAADEPMTANTTAILTGASSRALPNGMSAT